MVEEQQRNSRLTQKQETFCIKYFELGNASEAARLALYSPKTAAVIGAENLLKPKIQERIQGLRQKAEDESIAIVQERKQRLTVFIREDNYSKFGINRQSNIQAIAELNKMEKIYTENITIDNRTLNINVGDPKEKLISLLNRLSLRAGEAEGDTGTKPEGS